jgi:hypothetical protein
VNSNETKPNLRARKRRMPQKSMGHRQKRVLNSKKRETNL